jgi:hypothetical protein
VAEERGVKWILKGHANNGYFHSIANDRKKKCSIFSLEDGENEIRGAEALRSHIELFYNNLFSREDAGSIHLGDGMWDEKGSLSEEEAAELVKPFTLEEIERALKDMDISSAPGPDGLPVAFHREFWQDIKEVVLEMF